MIEERRRFEGRRVRDDDGVRGEWRNRVQVRLGWGIGGLFSVSGCLFLSAGALLAMIVHISGYLLQHRLCIRFHSVHTKTGMRWTGRKCPTHTIPMLFTVMLHHTRVEFFVDWRQVIR